MSMAGSACGAIFPVPLLPLLDEGRLIIISALIPFFAVSFSALTLFKKIASNNSAKRPWLMVVVVGSVGIILISVFFFTSMGVQAIYVKPSPYKALAQILQFPKTQIVESATDIRGRIDRVKTPYLRFAPGLSLKYMDALPKQDAIFRDGDNQFVTYEFFRKNDVRFAKYMLSFAGYHLTPNADNVLLIEYGGGSAIACALASGAHHISILEQSPHIAKILRQHYQLKVIKQNPRAFLAQSGDRFDIIHLENWGTSIPGTAALNQDYLFTKEAFTEYLNHLAADGVVTISRRLLLPPSDSLRIGSTAYEALKRIGVEKPEDHLAILRNWDTFTLVLSKAIINAESIIDFASRRNFDLVFLKGINNNMVNKFNVFDEPYHFQKINQLFEAYKSGQENDFFRSYLLDVAPQSDQRPFPSRFLKWSQVKILYKSLGSRVYALLMSGEIVVSVVFVEALVVTAVLLFVPLLLSTRRSRKPTLSQILYFLGVGAGFMFVELFFIQSFILLVGDPVISFTIVVCGILIFSSLGGLWAQNRYHRDIWTILPALIGVLILTAAGVQLLSPHILRCSATARFLIVLLFLLPPGFLMGLPFPLGMRFLLNSPVQRAYAWSVNGCASVLTSIISAQIAISFGIPVIIFCAVLSYIAALIFSVKR
jgi:hypothetical protein